jgi:DNA-binding NarL/FixJ family response regulator
MHEGLYDSVGLGTVRGAARSKTVGTLTPREVEVLKLLSEGLSTKQTAARLGITFKTAACHRSVILSKLDVHETVSAVRWAIRSGIVEA